MEGTPVIENAANHYLMWRKQDSGAIRVLNYSPVNMAYTNAQAGITNIQLVADDTVTDCEYPILFKNIVMTTSNGQVLRGNATSTITTEGSTAIKSLNTPTLLSDEIYDLSGRRINKAERGVNIINGKKIIK